MNIYMSFVLKVHFTLKPLQLHIALKQMYQVEYSNSAVICPIIGVAPFGPWPF